jgi:solute carrier family 25 (mitochondrial phosphate transporter), member 3
MDHCHAGILCAVVSQPADNMVSMLSANPKATMGSVLKDMGLVNLATRGLPLRILMVGTLTGLQWGIYDAYKVCLWSVLTIAMHEF